MHERPTDNGGRQTAQEVHSQSEAGDPEGMGFVRKWSGGLATPRDSSLDPVSLEEEIGTGSCGVSQRNPVQTESRGQGTAKGESEAQGHSDFTISGTDALEKKDELGLTGRKSGQAYTQEQRQRILDTVERLKSQRVSTTDALLGLKIPRSTFYFWKSFNANKTSPTSSNALLESETKSVISMKEKQP
ncbi:MAG: hypothetical protein WB554_07240, partial [Desulfomonilaceae bacterium]